MEPREDFQHAAPSNYAAMPGQIHEAGPRRRGKASPERTRELMTLAQGIAAQVESQVPPGPERCRLRQMVEMFLCE